MLSLKQEALRFSGSSSPCVFLAFMKDKEGIDKIEVYTEKQFNDIFDKVFEVKTERIEEQNG